MCNLDGATMDGAVVTWSHPIIFSSFSFLFTSGKRAESQRRPAEAHVDTHDAPAEEGDV